MVTKARVGQTRALSLLHSVAAESWYAVVLSTSCTLRSSVGFGFGAFAPTRHDIALWLKSAHNLFPAFLWQVQNIMSTFVRLKIDDCANGCLQGVICGEAFLREIALIQNFSRLMFRVFFPSTVVVGGRRF